MNIHLQQRTLATAISCSGMGVHSGKKVHLTIKPAPPNHGICFVRKDLPDRPSVKAHFNNVIDTSLATVIGENGVIISTIEHLMSCFAGLSIDNAIVELDNYEIPIMDGSAAPFVRLIRSAGIIRQIGPKCFFVVRSPIELRDGEKSVCAYPSSGFKITYTIAFDHPLIKTQSFSMTLSENTYESDISKARTFGFLHEVEYMKRLGLARGGTLENAVVIDKERVLNSEGLRYSDEFVRHKILDSIGDFSLLGMPMLGHLVIHKSGHAFNHAFLNEFFKQKSCWETLTVHDISRRKEYRAEAAEAIAV